MQLLDLLIVAALVLSRSCDAATSSNVPDNYTNVLILGAGMSGVAAARTLFINGITNFTVLEAGDGIGGRMRYDEERNIELGANWIHGLDLFNRTLHPLWREWMECNVTGPDGSVTPDFEKVYDDSGSPYDITNKKSSYKMREMAFEMAILKAGNISDYIADEYISVRGALSESNWTLQSSIDKFIEWAIVDYYFGVAPEELGLVHSYPDDALEAFLERDETGKLKNESVDYLVSDQKGFSFVVKCLARDFLNTSHLQLNARVTKVETLDEVVCVTVSDGSRHCALYAILTFSMGVLQAAIHGEKDAVDFKPDLPQNVKGYINQVTMVDYIPIFLIFNESFWNVTEQQVIGYTSELKGYYPLFFTVKNVPNTLFVHVTGDLARRVVRQNKNVTANEILTILRKIYNESIPDPIEIVVTNWSIDPLFMGAFEAYATGVPENIVEELLKPVNGRLYFAGSALNTSHYGFTHGAYSSGINVAKRVAEALNAGEYNV